MKEPALTLIFNTMGKLVKIGLKSNQIATYPYTKLHLNHKLNDL